VGEVKLHSIRLVISDPSTLFRFYRDGLGMTPQAGHEGEGYVRFADESGGNLELVARDDAVARQGDGSAPDDSTALVFETGNLHETVRNLRELGAEVVTEPTDITALSVRVARVRDPAGNVIVLQQRLL
jgi:predicted enzyme related to lactoylglutathione lyase